MIMSVYDSNLSDSKRQYLSKILNDKRKRLHSLGVLIDAILYLSKRDVPWRMLPHNFSKMAVSFITISKNRKQRA